MPTMIDANEAKALEVNRLAALIGDARLDATAAISLAIDAMDSYDPVKHGALNAREFLKTVACDRFMHIRNAGVAVRAIGILVAERP